MAHRAHRAALAAAAAFLVAACSGGPAVVQNAPPTGGVNGPGGSNQPPTISLSAESEVLIERELALMPSVRDPDGQPLTFSIENKPDWMGFSSTTGELRGTPAPVHVGTYRNVRVTVSDGQSQASAETTVVVVASADGRATLSWNAPTQRTDGSPLSDLAGFRVYFGHSRNDLRYVIEVTDPGARSWVVENLTRGAWFFAATAVDREGMESDYSNVASKTIS